jgi:hypothetical protein
MFKKRKVHKKLKMNYKKMILLIKEKLKIKMIFNKYLKLQTRLNQKNKEKN